MEAEYVWLEPFILLLWLSKWDGIAKFSFSIKKKELMCLFLSLYLI